MLSWLEERQPDVLLVQETKATDSTWPTLLFAGLGYESAHLGSGAWNGVAVLSRVGLDEVTYGLDNQPAYEGVTEPRAIGATCNGIRVWSLYVPNGRSIDHEHYRYKLHFLAAMAAQSAAERARLGSGVPYGLFGDFNVAPADADVWDIAAFDGRTHVSPAERDALRAIELAGGTDDPLTDLRPRASLDAEDGRAPYTFWEMRMLGFQKGRGMRIDLILANRAMAERATDVWVDRDARKGQGPSDHAPLLVDLRG
jgi:exodeoxyribonuclease-3